MKVLIINTSPLDFDGITLNLLSYFKSMDLTGMEVDLVSVKNSNPKIFQMIKEAGCGFYKIEKRSVNPLGYFIELISFMRKRKYDVIHAHGSSSSLAIEMLAAKIAGCKVRIAHSRNTKCNHNIIDKFLRPLLYATYTHGFACGRDAGKWLFGDRKFLVINNGKDLERYSFNENIRREVRSKYNWTDKIVLGHVGNFNSQKNHMFLTEVFAELIKKNSKYVLVMMGDGQTKTLVEKKIQEAGLSDKCFFLGSVTNVNELLQGMDIMLLPSLFEGLPNVVLEWQAAGLPCIISDAITQECKITELVKHMTLSAGHLAWSEAVINLKLKDRKEQSLEAIKYMQQAGFDINENAKELKRIYSSLVNGTKRDRLFNRNLGYEKKKILFVANKLGGGGAERVLTLIANELKNTGYDVSILIFAEIANMYTNKCNVVKLNSKNRFDQIIQLRRVFKDYNPDAIIAFEYFINMKTVLAALGLKMKVVISERNDPNKLNNKFLLKTFRNLLYACSDLLVCQTEDAKTCFSKKMQKKIVVILNPIKKDLPAWDNQNYKHKIINFCRLERQKNLPLLIDSFNEVLRTHPDYELLIYGEGKQKDFLQDYIKKKGLENYIKIEPFSSNIHQIASACQMFVSSSDYEGLSNSMLEAMAMGMPVICTDCPIGGARMVIKNRENGVLVPVGDKDALVNAMNWVIDNPDECRKLSVAAFNIRKELAIEEIIAQWRKLIY